MPRIVIDFEYGGQPDSALVIAVEDALRLAVTSGYIMPAWKVSAEPSDSIYAAKLREVLRSDEFTDLQIDDILRRMNKKDD
jgi:hypothetical protein